MTTIRFTKMQGTGNDFVLIDGFTQDADRAVPHAARLCRRRFGIGADQLLVLRPSSRAHAAMQIFNADGSEVEMCGNGVRCVARYLADRGRAAGPEIRVETPAGIVTPRIQADRIAVEMGTPRFHPSEIPAALDGEEIRDRPLSAAGREWRVTCLSMGNPHCVVRVDDVDRAEVETVGPALETHPAFPRRTNVEFVEVLGPAEIRMRVWERGAGETLSCGSGACAAVVAAARNGWTGREAVVHLRGGDLHVLWRGTGEVILSGPAEEVFRGEVALPPVP